MTLVLLPPLGAPAGALAPLVPALSRQAPVVLHDLPGQGLAAPLADTSLATLADGVIDALDRAQIDRADVCGFGLGGIVALRLALDHGPRVGRLVVACASAAPGNADAYRARARDVRERGLTAIARTTVRAWATPGALERQPALEARLAALLASCDAESYARCCDVLAAVDLTDDVGAITAPTLVLAAAQDRGLPPEHSRRLAALLPDATLRVVDDAAHLPWLERPGAVVDAIAEHLAQSPLEVVR